MGYSGNHNILAPTVRPRSRIVTDTICYTPELRFPDGKWVRDLNNSSSLVQDSYLVDPASSHMLVSKIKPCMSKYKKIIL